MIDIEEERFGPTDGLLVLVRNVPGATLFVRSTHWGWTLPGISGHRMLNSCSVAVAARLRLHLEAAISLTELRLARVLVGEPAGCVRKLAECRRTFVLVAPAWRGIPFAQFESEQIAWLAPGASGPPGPSDAPPAEWVSELEPARTPAELAGASVGAEAAPRLSLAEAHEPPALPEPGPELP